MAFITLMNKKCKPLTAAPVAPRENRILAFVEFAVLWDIRAHGKQNPGM
jgi:hypothetical protein